MWSCGGGGAAAAGGGTAVAGKMPLHKHVNEEEEKYYCMHSTLSPLRSNDGGGGGGRGGEVNGRNSIRCEICTVRSSGFNCRFASLCFLQSGLLLPDQILFVF